MSKTGTNIFTIEEIEAGEREVLKGKTLPEHLRAMTPEARGRTLVGFRNDALKKVLRRIPEDEAAQWKNDRREAR